MPYNELRKIAMRQMLIDAYLDYWNNYITVACYAEHNGLTTAQGEALLNLAREVYHSLHPEA